MKNSATKRFGVKSVILRIAMAVICIFASLGSANAFEINTGNEDVYLAWGNSIRYNLGLRVQARDDKIGNTATFDEGNYKFNRNDVVTNRLDVLSELDFAYKRQIGFRISGAGWFDAAYNDDVRTNPTFASRSSYYGNKYSDKTKRYTIGPSAELLDANVFANFDLGSMPTNIVAGRQTVLWGEAIVLSAHGVSYSQAPTDVMKALSSPGVDAKEVARPTAQIMGRMQMTPDLSMAAQYYFEWEASRYPEGGTYFAATDFILEGPNRYSAAPGLFLNRVDREAGRDYGNGGVNLRWSPKWLDGNIGLYFRRYDETNPWLSANVAARTYRAAYAKGVDLYGISLAKLVLDHSIGAEVTFRSNGALNSTNTNASGEGARGDTVHVLVNAIGNYGPTPVWSSVTAVAELAYSTYTKVRVNESLFNACYLKTTANSVADGCATKDNWVGYLRVTPSWVAVKPGWDIEMPMSISYGLAGNGATLGGGNERAGSYSIGVNIIYNVHTTLGFAYNAYLATYNDNGTSITTYNGSNQLQDRGWLSLTFKRSF